MDLTVVRTTLHHWWNHSIPKHPSITVTKFCRAGPFDENNRAIIIGLSDLVFVSPKQSRRAIPVLEKYTSMSPSVVRFVNFSQRGYQLVLHTTSEQTYICGALPLRSLPDLQVRTWQAPAISITSKYQELRRVYVITFITALRVCCMPVPGVLRLSLHCSP